MVPKGWSSATEVNKKIFFNINKYWNKPPNFIYMKAENLYCGQGDNEGITLRYLSDYL